MSATGRGAERQEDDFYITESWCVNALLAKLWLPGGRWLEPGAGNGAIVRAVQALRSDVEFTAVELRDTLVSQVTPCDWWRSDFLGQNTDLSTALSACGFSVTIGNPPYKYARQFIERALWFSKIVVYLLRLDFLGSRKRVQFWREYPADVYVLPDRPSFVVSIKCKGCGWRRTLPLTAKRPESCEECGGRKLQISTTDANEYGWFVWGMGGGKLVHLDPKSEIGPPIGSPVDLTRCFDCGEKLTHGHICKPCSAGLMSFHTSPCEFHEITQADIDAARVAADATIDENGNDVIPETTPSDLILNTHYVLADGRLVLFEGVASRYSFFAGSYRGGAGKIRLETASVQAWDVASLEGFECSACGWLIAEIATRGADCCPFCGNK